mgnify:FL=1|tara:strand:+ start:6223 stop:7221 length:999 start_codon:yes stop_codon:yes gene_type:complete
MAIAPLNKFITIAVPVAPGEQTLFEANVGTSAIVLYAQVSNVSTGVTFPTITFSHRRKSVATSTAGNLRNNRIVRDVDIPPSDAVILIDGRLVLERTAIVADSIVISGTQTGIATINDVKYDHTTGITTVTTYEPHGLSVDQEITMAGIAFTCPSTAGITSSLFPAPQRSFFVERVVGITTFETNTGVVNNLPHTFRPSEHRFIRSLPDAITVKSGTQINNKITPKKGTTYDAVTGILSVTTASAHNLTTGNTIEFNNNSLIFKCSQDNYFEEKSYPRSTDPARNGVNVAISTFVGIANTFTVNVGVTTTGGLVGPLQMEFICSILENSTAT